MNLHDTLFLLKIFLLFGYSILFLLFFIALLINRKIIKVTYQKEKVLLAYRRLEESKFIKISMFVLVVLILLTIPLVIFADEVMRDMSFVTIFACLYGVLGFDLLKKIFKLLGEAQ